jgi:hypothetical protein
MKARSSGAIRAAVKRSHAADVPAAARPDWRATWQLRQSQFVESVWVAMMRDPYRVRYAYVRPTDGVKWGELLAIVEGEPAPDGCELITAERIPSGDKATIARWLSAYAARLSVIPTDA